MPQKATKIQSVVGAALTISVVALGVGLMIKYPDIFTHTRTSYVYVREVPQNNPQPPVMIIPPLTPVGAPPMVTVQAISGLGNVIFVNAPCPHSSINIPVQPGVLHHYIHFSSDGNCYRKIFLKDGKATYVDGNEHYNIIF